MLAKCDKMGYTKQNSGTRKKEEDPMADHEKSVKLGEIIQEFRLEILHEGPDCEATPVTTLDVNRPGLPLAGFFEHFDARRLLVIGRTENTFLEQMEPEERRARFDRLLSYPVPALIITRALEPFPECMEMAVKHDRTVLRTDEHTSAFMSRLIGSLYNRLAPQITRSGVLMEIYGEGVLIQGESGVGKSEVAIELIQRGHRIVADDAVEIRVTNHNTLIAKAPELIRYYMELRGIGVVDLRSLFGMRVIKMEQEIDLVVTLEPWDDHAMYDRFGLEGAETEIMGVKVPAVTIPVKPGRNLASILEVAAINNRSRQLGHNAALELTQRMDEHFQKLMDGEEV